MGLLGKSKICPLYFRGQNVVENRKIDWILFGKVENFFGYLQFYPFSKSKLVFPRHAHRTFGFALYTMFIVLTGITFFYIFCRYLHEQVAQKKKIPNVSASVLKIWFYFYFSLQETSLFSELAHILQVPTYWKIILMVYDIKALVLIFNQKWTFKNIFPCTHCMITLIPQEH